MVNEITLSYKPSFCPLMKIVDVQSAIASVRKIYEVTECQIQLREYFFILCLNRNNVVTSYYLLSIGGIAGTVADTRLAFASAIKSLSSAIILCHNHPSGNAKPSEIDIKLTRRFKEAGRLLEIPVLDHIILTQESHYSFEENGLL